MQKANAKSSAKAISSGIFCALLLSAGDSSAQAAVSQSPLSLTTGVPPNLIFTLDDSGSMRWAFVPDSLGRENSGENIRNTRRGKSFHANPMYYNPEIKYAVPLKIDSSGVKTPYTTSFSAAYENGFRPGNGTVNLSSNYRVSWNYDTDTKPSYNYNTSTRYAEPTGKIFNLAENPALDFTTLTGEKESFSNQSNCQFNDYYTFSCESYIAGTKTKYRGERQKISSSNNNTKKGVPAYYYIFDKNLINCTSRMKDDDNCYKLIQVSHNSGVDNSDERQNFAIWYSFYRTRALATVSAANLAFSELSASTRITWQSLGNCTTLNGGNDCNNNHFKAYGPAHRKNFMDWLAAIEFDQSTPVRAALDRAGKFLQKDIAWQQHPNDPSKINNPANTYACRPSYHVLMTDGMWNGKQPSGTFNHDNKSFALPDGTQYTTPKHPYSDPTADTLADLAMHYWATDLRPDMANRLKPYMPFKHGNGLLTYWDPRNNPATWQHMVNFTMGLGLSGSMNLQGLPWEGVTFSGTGYHNLKNGFPWPEAKSDSDNNVYDLWHAAINSRGGFFSVDSPDAMVQAFADMLSRIADRKSTAAKPAINSGQLSEDGKDNGPLKTAFYQTSYASGEHWAGDLKRLEKQWNLQENVFAQAEIWSAKNKVPGPNNRNIYIAGQTNSGLADFSWSNAGRSDIPGTLANYLAQDPDSGARDNRGEQRLNYLRGERSGEGSVFRARSTVLGDLYSSSPAVVSGPRYLIDFANRLEGNDAYSSFVAKINGTLANGVRNGRIYVGANDGMLHGFNLATGVEEFAFIPTAVFKKLNKLTGNSYTHEFYVEGSPVVADIYDGANWRTILVGTLKAGGKSIFALDVTTPGREELLWEFDDNSLTDRHSVKMGYSFAQPTIARLHTGKWAVVIGNGYESANDSNGKAALFIIDAVNGTLITSLEVNGSKGIANGLSTPRLADFNADGVADYAYAGDLQGNLWRFDLLGGQRSSRNPLAHNNSATASDFKVSYGASPLFSALAADGKTRQPITSAPSLIRHPSGSGYLVIFGTGKYFEVIDKGGDKSIAQSVYGIWDTRTRGEDGNTRKVKRNDLQAQTVTRQLSGTTASGESRLARVISNNPVRWTASEAGPAQSGWVLDLAQGTRREGEMVVEDMVTLGQTIFFQSLIPNDDPCEDGASNWTYAINPYTGGRTQHHALDVKQINEPGSTIVSSIYQNGEGGITLSQAPHGFELCTGQECVSVYPDPGSLGRQSWRVVEDD